MDILTYALAKSYTDKALLGVGTIKGAPCTVKSQTEDDEYVYVTLGWENSLGTPEETVVKIKKGADGAPGEQGPAGDPGPQGVSITKIEKIKTEGLIDTYQISFSDNTTFEYTISNGSTDYLNITNKPSIEGVELTGNKTFEDLNIASADALSTTDENLQNLSDLIGDKTSLPTPTDTIVNNITSVDTKVDAIIDDNEAGLAKTFSSDKITKTFATLEEANKRIPQYDVLPAPTEAFGGKVVQFIGATTEDYIHNYFYECVEVEGSYKWVNVVVQNVPTKVSELTNDSNFVTETELNEKGYLTEHQDISGKVDKEEGKSLIADSEITRLSTVKNYDDSVVKEDIATIKTDYATKTYVGEQIAAADHLKREIVTEVPTVETAAENVIYMLKVESTIGADKYKEYMLIDGEVACVGDTSVDLTDYAKKSEIPTELPANGGNSDTVNRHTVKSDVPENAVFTDTIYDDTEVKESIEELNSNLDILEYSEVAGGNNIFKANKNGYYGPSGNILKSEIYVCSDIIPYEESVIYVSLDKIYSELNDGNGAWIGFVLFDADKNYIENSYTSSYQRGRLKYSITVNSGTKYVAISKSKDANVCISSKDIDYEPYIPSVKMLADKVNAQNESLSDYGLNNVFDGVWEQGGYNGSTGEKYSDTIAIRSVTPISVKSGSLCSMKANSTIRTARWVFFNGSTFVGTDVGFFVKAPSNSTTAYFHVIKVDGGAITPQTVGEVNVYINNAIEELNSNLSQLELSEVAGGKNLFNPKCLLNATYNEKTNTINVSNNTNKALDMVFKENTQYTFSAYIKQSNSSTNNRLTITYTDGTSKSTFLYTQSVSEEYLSETSQSGKTISEVKWNHGSSGTATFRNFQIEKGTQATDYEPYIPSVKMLAEENAQQNIESMDLKMLGWTVPSECPVQNYVDADGVFHQRVGRVDLEDALFEYNDTYSLWSSSYIKNIAKYSTTDQISNTNFYSNMYSIYNGNLSYIPTDSFIMGTSGILWVNNGSSTKKPSGYLYFELAEEKTINVDGNEATELINESLDDYGLNNKFDGMLIQQKIDVNSLNRSYDTKCVSSLNKIPVSGGQLLKLITQSGFLLSHIIFTTSSGTKVEHINCNTNGITIVSVPDTASYMEFDIRFENDTTPSQVGHIGVYINNAIDEIKNDLDTLELSDVAGGKNIAHDVICVPQTGNWKNLASGYAKLIQGIQYTMSFTVTSDGSGKIYIPSSSGFESGNPVININSGTTRITRTVHAIGNDGITKSVFVSTYEGNSATISITDFMIEEGTTATPYEPYIPSVKMLAEEKADKSETTVNLLNPTLQTTTKNGITCTNNGDGTYTLNGTANARCLILVGTISIPNNIGKTVKLLGSPKGGLNTTYHMECTDNQNNDSICKDISYGGIKKIQQWSSSNSWYIYIIIEQNVSLDNLVFKPMLTTNLDATYDDFVQYTGDTGKLNNDVAAIKKDIGNLTGDIDAKTVNGHTVESNVPANAKFTDTVYDDTSIKNKLTTHTHDNRYYTETEVNNLLNGKANSSHSHGAYELPVGSIFLSSRKVAPGYGNWEYLGTIQSLFSDLPLIQAIGEGYVYSRTS